MNNPEKATLSPRRVFLKCGACSHAMFHLLNHEFDNINAEKEKAADLLAGGIALKGHQCGMLWGGSLAIGAEAFRRHSDTGNATAAAINTSKLLIESFHDNAGSVNCRDITKTDWDKKSQFIVFVLKTMAQGFIFSFCFRFIKKWTPKAAIAAREGLSGAKQSSLSCATEVLKKMGATDENAVTVAGLAGGIGLSGNGCGALSAVIWYKMLEWSKENPGKTAAMKNNPIATEILNAFYEQTGSEMVCRNICGKKFQTLEEHTEYLKNGGCSKLIDALSALK